MEFKIKQERNPTRCEICHQTDRFDPEINHCARCQLLKFDGEINQSDQINMPLEEAKPFEKNPSNPESLFGGIVLFVYLASTETEWAMRVVWMVLVMGCAISLFYEIKKEIPERLL